MTVDETFDEPVEWTVTVSGHASFPRWAGPTEEAFERASWQFEGPLHGALEVMGQTQGRSFSCIG